jgi:hypothetical protein
LSRNRTAKRVAEITQNTHVMELEWANAELKAELEHAHLKIAEVEEHHDSLRSGYQKLENVCERLHNTTEMLKQEKIEAEKTRHAEIATINAKF